MLKIRLTPFGRKKHVIYRIVVMKSLTRRNGKAICNLGYYNPQTKLLKVNKKLLSKFIQYGAYPTNTIRHILLKLK